ncbi:hypothetical protein F2Q69_00002046 [Brassica cretica]|nr:hypothetical protein F2Q69_00002046 [Brassica cretica]
MAMHSSSAAEYVEYDHYLIKKWEYSGFDKNDNIYVNTKPKSRVARSAKRFYGFRLSTQGKFFLSLPKTKPDMSKMNMRGYGSQVFMAFKITTSLEPLQ